MKRKGLGVWLGICLFLALPSQARAGLEEAEAAWQAGKYQEAVIVYQALADQGMPHAQFNLGIAYISGEGVPEDVVLAVSWFRKAAEQNLAGAQYNLGYAYANGFGVPKDEAEAIVWYQKAAAQGHKPAQEALKKLGR